MSTAKSLLIGLRGSGKTTVGRRVAEELGVEFIDLDERVREAFGGVDISTVFQQQGEPAFRARESSELSRVMDEPIDAVVALGGGTPTAPGVDDFLRSSKERGRALIVYLRADPDVLARRLLDTGIGEDRPSLTGGDPIEEIREVFDRRDPLYRALADAEVDASCTTEHVVSDVVSAVRDRS